MKSKSGNDSNVKRGSRGLVMLLMLWGATLLFAGMRGGLSAWFLVYSVGALVLYCMAIQLDSLRRAEVTRSISHDRHTAGESVTVTLRIRNRSWLPLAWLVVRDEWFHPGEQIMQSTQSRQLKQPKQPKQPRQLKQSMEATQTARSLSVRQPAYVHRKLFIPWFSTSYTYEYKIEHVRRGLYEAHSIALLTGDLFGLITKQKRVKASSRFTIYPKSLTVRHRPAARYSDSGDLGLMVTAAQWLEDTSQVSGVRDYAHGDSLHRIHWRTTARLNRLQTKEMEAPGTKRMLVYLDASKESYLSDPSSLLFETCIEAAAGLLQYGDMHKFSMGFLCNSQGSRSIPLMQSFPLMQAYEILAAVSDDGQLAWHNMLQREAVTMPARTYIVCITAAMDERLIHTVQELRMRRMDVQVVFVHNQPALSWHLRQLQQQLDSLGCVFQELRPTMDAMFMHGNVLEQGGINRADI